MISLAVAYAMPASAGSNLLGINATTSPTLAVMTDAGLTTLVSQAATALVGNGGDIGAALKQLGSSATLKSLATSMVTAGLIEGLGVSEKLTTPTAELDAMAPAARKLAEFTDKLQIGIAQGAIGVTVDSVVNGADFNDGMITTLRNAGVKAVLATTQSVIGDLTDGVGANDLPVANMVAHALAGGLASEALGGDFKSGAASALASSMAANAGMLDGLSADQISAVSNLLGGIAAVVAQGDASAITQGATIAQSAAINNYLTHANIKDMTAELEACQAQAGGCTETQEKEIALKWVNTAIQNDKILAATCADLTCVETTLSQAVVLHSSEALAINSLSPTAYNILHSAYSFNVLQPALEQVDRNIAFKNDYDNYVTTQCSGVSSAACSDAHYSAWVAVQDKQEVFNTAKTILSVAIGGGMTVGPKAFQALKACVATSACVSELGVTLVEVGAETVAGAPIASTAGLALPVGTIALQKGDQVLGLIDDTLGHLGRVEGDATLFRAMGGSLHKLDSAGTLQLIPTAIKFDGQYYAADGFKISGSYYDRLWSSGGRPAPFLQARAVMGSNPTITPDPRGMTGFFRYEGAGMEMVYNPSTGEVWHIQPLR